MWGWIPAKSLRCEPAESWHDSNWTVRPEDSLDRLRRKHEAAAMSVSKRDAIYDELLCRLICGRYRFGDRIIVNDVAAETRASRQPIGAALNALAAEGYVRVVPQVGCDVVDPSSERIGDFFRYLGVVEQEFAGLAAARGEGGRRAVMVAARRLAEDWDGLISGEKLRRGKELLDIVHAMAGSPLLGLRYGGLMNMANFFVMQCTDTVPDLGDFRDRLNGLAENVATGDVASAKAAARTHIAGLAQTCLA
jgi:DNA-binding GntR family transcriptional regulator